MALAKKELEELLFIFGYATTNPEHTPDQIYYEQSHYSD
jgi:hypothetical protein